MRSNTTEGQMYHLSSTSIFTLSKSPNCLELMLTLLKRLVLKRFNSFSSTTAFQSNVEMESPTLKVISLRMTSVLVFLFPTTSISAIVSCFVDASVVEVQKNIRRLRNRIRHMNCEEKKILDIEVIHQCIISIFQHILEN